MWDRVQNLKKGAEKRTDNYFDFRVRHKPRFHSLGGSTGHVWLSPCVQGSDFPRPPALWQSMQKKGQLFRPPVKCSASRPLALVLCLTLDLVYNCTKPSQTTALKTISCIDVSK